MRARRLGAILLAALFARTGCAHSMYQGAVMLDFDEHEIHAELQLPVERMETAFGESIGARLSLDQQARYGTYVLEHFAARTAEGRAFVARIATPLGVESVDGAPYVVARLVLTPAAGAMPEKFEVDDDALLERIPGQVSLVSIRSDWSNGVFANDPQLLGVIRGSTRSLPINRAGGEWLRGFGSIFKLGVRHIAEGTDHLLFLLALLLAAPLSFDRAGWAGPASTRHSLFRIVQVVSAFTVGHSITLALAATGLVHAPSRPIEGLIAASIFVSAVHALRPIFPGREAVIAACFGLIHGLAFATTLSELGLGRWQRMAGILAFNLGIESMQLAVVVVTIPSLLLLSRTKVYWMVRIPGAVFAGVASLCWMAERLLGQRTAVDLVVDAVAQQAAWIAAVLFLASLLLWRLAGGREQSEIAVCPPAERFGTG